MQLLYIDTRDSQMRHYPDHLRHELESDNSTSSCQHHACRKVMLTP
jgi:hypothetical protein